MTRSAKNVQRRWRFDILLFVAITAILFSLASLTSAGASETGHACTASNHCTNNLTELSVHSDSFRNYDFNSQSLHNNNVDWPVTIVFWNNAEIDYVKNELTAYNPDLFRGSLGNAGEKNLYLKEGEEWVNGSCCVPANTYYWDTDKGLKDEGICTGDQGRHVRLYADPYTSWGQDQLYNDSWGYFILGSTHLDWNDGGSTFGSGCNGTGSWHGFSENAEDWLEWYSNNVPGWSTLGDFMNFYNYEPSRVDGGGVAHYWDNNGNTTFVYTD